MFNSVWQTQIRYNSRKGISPANCAVVPKKTHVPVSIHSTVTTAVPVAQCAVPTLAIYGWHTEVSASVPGRRHHRLHDLGPLTQAASANSSPSLWSAHMCHTPHLVPSTRILTCVRELTTICCQTPRQPWEPKLLQTMNQFTPLRPPNFWRKSENSEITTGRRKEEEFHRKYRFLLVQADRCIERVKALTIQHNAQQAQSNCTPKWEAAGKIWQRKRVETARTDRSVTQDFLNLYYISFEMDQP